MIKDLFNILKSNPITNIFIVGYIDSDSNLKRFNVIQVELYLEFKDFLLRCSSVNQYSKLKIDIVDEISYVFDWQIEEEDEFCYCSISDMYLSDPYGTNMISSAEFLLDDECNIDDGLVQCARLSIGDKDYLFLDPTHTFGIQINKQTSMSEWIQNKAYKKIEYKNSIWQAVDDTVKTNTISFF